MHRLFQSLLTGMRRAPLDFCKENFWNAVGMSDAAQIEYREKSQGGKTQAKPKSSPHHQPLYPQLLKNPQVKIKDAASDPKSAPLNEKIKAPSVAAPYGSPANLAISDTLLHPPPSFPPLRIKT